MSGLALSLSTTPLFIATPGSPTPTDFEPRFSGTRREKPATRSSSGGPCNSFPTTAWSPIRRSWDEHAAAAADRSDQALVPRQKAGPRGSGFGSRPHRQSGFGFAGIRHIHRLYRGPHRPRDPAQRVHAEHIPHAAQHPRRAARQRRRQMNANFTLAGGLATLGPELVELRAQLDRRF